MSSHAYACMHALFGTMESTYSSSKWKMGLSSVSVLCEICATTPSDYWNILERKKKAAMDEYPTLKKVCTLGFECLCFILPSLIMDKVLSHKKRLGWLSSVIFKSSLIVCVYIYIYIYMFNGMLKKAISIERIMLLFFINFN